jgi:ribosomal protein S18 acetylase RimI-like enzyme
VGLAALYRDQEKSSQVEMIQVWVAPSHRRSGVGEALLNHLFDWAAKNSYESVKAEVADGNHGAMRFYLNYGFAKFHSEGCGTCLIKMTKNSKI